MAALTIPHSLPKSAQAGLATQERGYRLSTQRRHGTTSKRSTSSPTASSKTV